MHFYARNEIGSFIFKGSEGTVGCHDVDSVSTQCRDLNAKTPV